MFNYKTIGMAPMGSQKCRPNYAIVRIPESTNVLSFYQLLLENGYSEVSFVNEVRENAFLPSTAVSTTTTTIATHLQQQGLQQKNHRSNGRTPSVVVEQKKGSSNNLSTVIQSQYQQQVPASVPARARTTVVPISGYAATVRSSNNALGAAPSFVASPASSASSTVVAAPMALHSSTVEEFAVCLLCNNRIMSSRLSNLTNHVKRHASLKQYKCSHCEYAHNEMAKVRLHLQHNHNSEGEPVDMLNFEMQIQWGLLMDQCFPEHSKRFGPSAANSQYRNLDDLQKYVEMDRQYTCIECGEMLPGYRLINHLEDTHQSECTPFACGQCGFQSSSQWKVRLHISVKHPERAAETTVASLSPGSNYILFLQKFFNEVHIPGEEDEEKLVAELREKNLDQFIAVDVIENGASVDRINKEEENHCENAAGNGNNGDDLMLTLTESSPEEMRAMDDGETVPKKTEAGAERKQSSPAEKASSTRKRETPAAEEMHAQPAKRQNLRHSHRLMASEKGRRSLQTNMDLRRKS